MRLEYIGLSELSGSLIALEGVKDVAYDEMAEVTLENGERRYGRVILIDGDRVVIIEDVTTSGKSIEETFPILKEQANVDVVGLMVSLNRQERGRTQKNALAEIREVYGIETGAIVTMEEVVEHLYNRKYNGRVLIDDAMKEAIDTYYAQYGAK